MTTTADHPLQPGARLSGLRDLDRSDVLDLAVSSRRNADREEACLLAAAVHWVDLHPVTEAELPLAGEGTPGIAEYAVEELAAALDLSHAAGLALVSEAVELCFRLPRLWALVQDGRLQAWKARQVARATTELSRDSVAFVDRHLAVTGRRNRIPALNPVLHEARLQCDPDQALAVERSALEQRGVWFDHRESTATTMLTARLDTLDALDLDGSVADLASTIGRLGDTRALDVRRATALGCWPTPSVCSTSVATRSPVPRQGPAAPAALSTCTWMRPTSKTRHDARDRYPPRRTLRVPWLRHRRPVLRPRPHHAVRSGGRGRTPGPDVTSEPCLSV
jgi:hypothetical protein